VHQPVAISPSQKKGGQMAVITSDTKAKIAMNIHPAGCTGVNTLLKVSSK